MSRPTIDTERANAGPGERLVRLGGAVPVAPRTLAGLLALVPVAGATLYRVAHNAPGTLPPAVIDTATALLPLAVAAPALAALLLAGAADRRTARLGLAFVGAFGLVSLAGGSAWFPAAVGVSAGLLVLVGGRGRSALARGTTEVRQAGVLALLTAGVLVSLAATAGLAPATLRPVGSGLALLGVGLLPASLPTDRLALLAGAAAGLLTVAVASSVPYVAGAVLLVGGGVVGVPVGLVALAVGGGVAATVGGLRRVIGGVADADGSLRPVGVSAAVAPVLLLTAGVPGTLLRAVGVAVAVGLLAGGDPS
ncbi:hypothetical protein [Salinirubrum litoreum]|uniref:DUF8068 domain-containing protein n=1 Tax=Salinirubrum litoreum TaxID=1126234 RepID=A0ABD5RBV8_9EURY|nr:hypothetical protein [Salinirubrum litoreum]